MYLSTNCHSQTSSNRMHSFFVIHVSGLLCVCWYRRVTELTDSLVEFGLIPHDDWYQPPWINETQAAEARAEMERNRVIYGGMHAQIQSTTHH
jgi:hypothetical protein